MGYFMQALQVKQIQLADYEYSLNSKNILGKMHPSYYEII